MSTSTEKRIEEVVRWYEYHKNTIPPENLLKRIDFLQKTIDCQFELIVRLIEDIDPLEHKAGTRSRALWLPSGMKMNGDVRKLG